MVSSRRRRSDGYSKESLENGELKDSDEPSDIRGDRLNIALLLFLYTLQGIPLGLAGAIPMLLQNRGVSYKEQAEFSLVNWPFSLKLLWAPIVDALYWSRVGRRKSWLVPAQYCLGGCMLLLAVHVDSWLGEDPQMVQLTVAFFTLNFLAATQDIAVDGWALTMLKRCNVGHASTCNSVGQTAGFFLGYVIFIALESANFCNSYLRSEPQPVGIVTLSGFLWVWGWIFVVSTTLVALFKQEAPETIHRRGPSSYGWRKLTAAYKQLWRITKLPAVRTLAMVLLTAKVAFSSSDAVSSLKLVEAGVPREQLALMVFPMVPIQILLPLILAKQSTGSEPLTSWLRAYPVRVAFALVAASVVAVAPFLIRNTPVPVYLIVILLLYGLHQILTFTMFVGVMAFFARVSDPLVGGTYMTLLNTLANLGAVWPNTLALWAVDPLTSRSCGDLPPANATQLMMDNMCTTHHDKQMCTESGGTCLTYLDGFYVETLICFLLGLCWLRWGQRRVRRLQSLPLSSWHLPKEH